MSYITVSSPTTKIIQQRADEFLSDGMAFGSRGDAQEATSCRLATEETMSRNGLEAALRWDCKSVKTFCQMNSERC